MKNSSTVVTSPYLKYMYLQFMMFRRMLILLSLLINNIKKPLVVLILSPLHTGVGGLVETWKPVYVHGQKRPSRSLLILSETKVFPVE